MYGLNIGTLNVYLQVKTPHMSYAVKHTYNEYASKEFMLIAKWYLFSYERNITSILLDMRKFGYNELFSTTLELYYNHVWLYLVF